MVARSKPVKDLKLLQGVRFNVGISSTGLKSTFLSQNWHDIAYFEGNTPPFVILSKKFDKLVLKDEILQLS